MKDKFFLDTNVFVYAFDDTDSFKMKAANKLISYALSSQKGCISYQVIQEFLNLARRKFNQPLTIPDCQQYLNSVLDPLCEVYAGIDRLHKRGTKYTHFLAKL